MKKESFQGFLLFWAGLLIAAVLMAFMFKHLHWPGGCMLAGIVAPVMLIVQAVCMLCFVPKYGALKAQKEAGNSIAKHLYNIEMSAPVFAVVLAIGMLFRCMHWPGGAQLVLVSCTALAILGILAGILGCAYVNKK